MKSTIFLFATLCFVSTAFANTIFKDLIKLPKENKVESTFSGNISEQNTFHLIFTKNKKTKNYELFSYFFNGENIEKLAVIKGKEKYNVVSFHTTDGFLSVFFSFKKNKKSGIRRFDYNLLTKEITRAKAFDHKDYDDVIRRKSKSIFIYSNKKRFYIREFIGMNQYKEYFYEYEKKDKTVSDFFKSNSANYVKDDEFVANGSTSVLKVYYEDNHLFFTKNKPENKLYIGPVSLNLEKGKIETVSFLLEEEKLTPKYAVFSKNNKNPFKKITSYVYKKKLFELKISRKKGQVLIYNIADKTKFHSINLDASLSNKIIESEKFEGIETFLKQAARNRYKPTITVNEMKDGTARVRVDYVDIVYAYHNNWWWHHQQFMLHQQQFNQMQFSVPTGFGPASPNDFYFTSMMLKKEKHFFEFLVDENGFVLPKRILEPIYQEIDKSNYIDKLEKIKDYKFESSCFLTNSYRFIAYSKKEKGFIIYSSAL